jgi:Mg2+/Co2+ transporter CorB
MKIPLLVSLIAIFLLLLLSAFFSGSETALTAASKGRMKRLSREGKKGAKAAAELIEDRERFLGGILLGNNLVNILASAMATGVLIAAFGESGVFYATLIMTALILIFAELLPKTYAISKADRVALWVGPVIRLVVLVLDPLVAIVRKIVQLALKLFGVDLSQADRALVGPEEIRDTIDLQESEGEIRKADRDMLGSILDLDAVSVEDVMVHRKDMNMFDVSQPAGWLFEEVIKSPHTRLPLWKDNPENIVGVLHAKDVLRALKGKGMNADKLRISHIMTKPWFVPETTSLRNQLNSFLARRSHFALVVDEYGALMGLVTLEDILEEIVGDIADEHDFEAEGVELMADGAVAADGRLTIRDLNRHFDWELPDQEAVTIAGLVIQVAEIIPIVGQRFKAHGFEFEILGRQRNQITRVGVRPLASALSVGPGQAKNRPD